jgi:hypothetical protein
MKPQDIIFVIIFIGLFFVKKQEAFVWAGLVCLLGAIPLFARWTFFTAERLTWYAAAFFFTFIIFSFVKERKLPYNEKRGKLI